MKQTQTWSLAGEEAVSYSLARGKAAAVTRESGEIAAYSLAPWREQSLALYLGRAAGRDRGKTPQLRLTIGRGTRLGLGSRRTRYTVGGHTK